MNEERTALPISALKVARMCDAFDRENPNRSERRVFRKHLNDYCTRAHDKTVNNNDGTLTSTVEPRQKQRLESVARARSTTPSAFIRELVVSALDAIRLEEENDD